MDSSSSKQCPDLILGNVGLANVVGSFRVICYVCHEIIQTDMTMETALLYSKNLFFCTRCKPQTGAELMLDDHCKSLLYTKVPTKSLLLSLNERKGRLTSSAGRLTSSGDDDNEAANNIPASESVFAAKYPTNTNKNVFSEVSKPTVNDFLSYKQQNLPRYLSGQPHEECASNFTKMFWQVRTSQFRSNLHMSAGELQTEVDHLIDGSSKTTDSKPNKVEYRCQYCNKSFVYRAYWRHHEEKFMCRKANSCRICGKVYAHRSSLSRHRQSHLSDNGFNCV